MLLLTAAINSLVHYLRTKYRPDNIKCQAGFGLEFHMLWVVDMETSNAFYMPETLCPIDLPVVLFHDEVSNSNLSLRSSPCSATVGS